MKEKPFKIGCFVRLVGSEVDGIHGVIETYKDLRFDLRISYVPEGCMHTTGSLIEVSVHEMEHFWKQPTATESSTDLSLAMEVLLMTGV